MLPAPLKKNGKDLTKPMHSAKYVPFKATLDSITCPFKGMEKDRKDNSMQKSTSTGLVNTIHAQLSISGHIFFLFHISQRNID